MGFSVIANKGAVRKLVALCQLQQSIDRFGSVQPDTEKWGPWITYLPTENRSVTILITIGWWRSDAVNHGVLQIELNSPRGGS